MSTINSRPNTDRRARNAHDVRQRRRLENLLYTRKRVAHLAAEYRSHGLEDHVELYLLQLELEQVIADEFPSAFEQYCGDWAEEEAAGEHHPLVSSTSCGLCRAIDAHDRGEPNTPLAA